MTFRSAGAYDGWVLEQDETSGKGGTFDTASTAAAGGQHPGPPVPQHPALRHLRPARRRGDHRRHHAGSRSRASSAPTRSTPTGYLTVDMKTGSYHDNPALEKLDFHAVGSRGNVGRFIKTPAVGWYRAPLRAAVLPAGQPDRAHPVPAAVRHRRQRRPGRRLPVLLHAGTPPQADRPRTDRHLLRALSPDGLSRFRGRGRSDWGEGKSATQVSCAWPSPLGGRVVAGLQPLPTVAASRLSRVRGRGYRRLGRIPEQAESDSCPLRSPAGQSSSPSGGRTASTGQGAASRMSWASLPRKYLPDLLRWR